MTDATSIQYGLGVDIGHLVVGAMKAGASYHEVLDTLRHATALVERNMAWGVELTSAPVRPGRGRPDKDGVRYRWLRMQNFEQLDLVLVNAMLDPSSTQNALAEGLDNIIDEAMSGEAERAS